jgi:hypothetical protein
MVTQFIQELGGRHEKNNPGNRHYSDFFTGLMATPAAAKCDKTIEETAEAKVQ